MKQFKYFIAFLSLGVLFSCETAELEITENPNFLTPSQADPNFLLSEVQENFGRLIHSLGDTGGEFTRIQQLPGRDYQNAYGPTSFDGEWELAYQEIMQNIKLMNALAEEASLNSHIGIGQVIQAYTLVTLVDFFGDVPYSEALLGDAETPMLNPALDPGEQVYAAALTLLDQAVVNLPGGPAPSTDLFYRGNLTNWVKAANSIKMKIYLNQGDVTAFNAVTNYITSNSEDFQFHWGSNEIQPDTRHPYFAAGYTDTGGGFYQSNWLMNEMLEGVNGVTDPRRFYYFYRQNEATPSFDGAPANEEVLECSLFDAPIHYQQNNQVFCGVASGYWGRDHGNSDGIPPDGFLRTLPGVYPAGGIYDNNSFADANNQNGQDRGYGGAGITPIMLASWVDFMKAEISDERANTLSGARKSIEKVTSFGMEGIALSFEDLELTDQEKTNMIEEISSTLNTRVESYLEALAVAYDASSNKSNIRAKQYWIAMYGNGIDAYNAYRRTGLPSDLQLNIEPNPGAFPTIMFYPGNAATTNSNIAQRENLTSKPFWNTQTFNLN